LIPHYGQPWKSRNEIDRGQPKQGTTPFHAYATACIVRYGQRYTLALTWVRRHESTVTVPRRLPLLVEAGASLDCLLPDVWAGEHPEQVLAQRQEESGQARHRRDRRRALRRAALAAGR
jgi:hypothetical protein